MATPIVLKDIMIHPVIEQERCTAFRAMEFFPSVTSELLDANRSWLAPRFLEPGDDALVFCIQGFVIKTPHHTILVDSCVGNDKSRPSRQFWHMMNSDRFMQSLASIGLTVDDIDYVMCTHLHTDHVGWNTRLDNGRWVPTFPNAKYIMADRELDYWVRREGDNPSSAPWITDSVLPIVAAKREQIVKSDFVFNDQVRLLPTPGHTIDHFSVLVGEEGRDALIGGDLIHSPLQGRFPEISMMADFDGKQAGQTRRAIFDRLCELPTILCATHFPAPSAVRVQRWGEGYKFADTDA